MRKVTPLFLKQVEAALAVNRVYNTKHKLRKGDVGYRIGSHQDLADALNVDPNSIKNLLGGVRPGTKAKAPGRSKLVDPICDLLGIERLIEVAIPAKVADDVLFIAALPVEEIAELMAKIRKK